MKEPQTIKGTVTDGDVEIIRLMSPDTVALCLVAGRNTEDEQMFTITKKACAHLKALLNGILPTED